MRRSLLSVLLAIGMIIGLSFPEVGHPAATPTTRLNIAVAAEPFSLDIVSDSAGVNGVVFGNITAFHKNLLVYNGHSLLLN